MKRVLAALVAAAVLSCLIVGVAGAARLSNPETLRWQNQNASNAGPATVPVPGVNGATSRDTIYKQIKVGATDTTATFSTEGWVIPEGSVADSLVIGTLWVQTDSTAAGSFTATSFTITPQWSAGGNDLQWTSGAAITFTDVTANDLMFKFPIYIVGNTTRGVLNAAGWPAPKYRFLIVAIGGVVSPARAWVSHLLPNGQL